MRKAHVLASRMKRKFMRLNRNLPFVGDQVETADGFRGEVNSVNILKQLVKGSKINLPNDEKEIREYKADEIKVRNSRKKQRGKRAAEEASEGKELHEAGKPRKRMKKEKVKLNRHEPEG